jgi:hypothetical protein
MTSSAELESRGAMKLAIDHIEWMANTVHQAHHGQSDKSWRDCDKGVCISTIRKIAELREVWQVKPAGSDCCWMGDKTCPEHGWAYR